MLQKVKVGYFFLVSEVSINCM